MENGVLLLRDHAIWTFLPVILNVYCRFSFSVNMRMNCDWGGGGGCRSESKPVEIEKERSCHRQWHEQISHDALISSLLDLRTADQTCDARTSRNKWAVQALYVVVNMWWSFRWELCLATESERRCSQRSGKKSEHTKSSNECFFLSFCFYYYFCITLYNRTV